MISFLAFSDILGWFTDIPSNFFGMLKNGLRMIFSFISIKLYEVMISLYNVFDVLCFSRLLDNEALNALSQRIGLILGLLMLFYVVFSFIKMLIDPDQITDKTKGAVGIIKRVLVVIVMLGVSSFVFNTLFTLQTAIVKNHVITKVILPYKINEDEYNNKIGNIFAAELFYAFYHVDDAFLDDDGNLTEDWENDSDVATCLAITYTLKDEIYNHGDFYLVDSCLNETTPIVNAYTSEDLPRYIIYFNWLFMVGIGILVDYFLISYCIAVGVRMVRLLVLEVISPMAFVSYLLPKQDGFFSKWIKTYFSTYLDVFIRIGIINFVLFLCMTILGQDGSWEFWKHIGEDQPGSLKLLLTAFMVVALLSFAKKAPDLLKELGFSGGSFGGFHIKDAFGLQRGAGAVTGAIGGIAGAAVGGGNVAVGLLRGAGKGFSGGKPMGASAGFGSAKSGALRDAQRIAAGGSRIVLPGAQARADRFDAEKEQIEAQGDYYKTVAEAGTSMIDRAHSKMDSGEYVDDHTIAKKAALNTAESLKKQASELKESDFDSWSSAELADRMAGDPDSYKKRSDFASDDDFASYMESERIKLRNEEFKAQQEALAKRISEQEHIASQEDDKAVQGYIQQQLDLAKSGGDADKAIITAQRTMVEADRTKPTGSATLGGDITSGAGLFARTKSAKGEISNNAIKLAQNKDAGKAARADAKYSGGGK